METLTRTDREVVVSRRFDAPRALVYRVWTEPEHVAQWWGPNGFRNTVYEMEVRPGGVWRFTMHGPDGVDYPNRIDFLEVVPAERLVYSHGDDGGPLSFHVTVTFEEVDGQTEVTMRSLFATAEALEYVVREHQALEGAKQHLGRLADHLAGLQAAGKTTFEVPTEEPVIVMRRLFDAPRPLVFEVFTNPEHIRRWYGCESMPMSVCDVDFRVGGHWRFVLRAPDGNEYGFEGEYREIVPPERTVSTERFDGAPGAEAVVTMVLEERGRQTQLTSTVVHQSLANRDAHYGAGMAQGASLAMDRLAALLESLA